MISVGRNDGRKGLGFGIGGDMDETEVEEGEACYYQNHDDDDDSPIDPDVALSYIVSFFPNLFTLFQISIIIDVSIFAFFHVEFLF